MGCDKSVEDKLVYRYYLPCSDPEFLGTTIMAGAFKKLVKKLESKGLPKSEAGGIAYKQGAKKFGKAGMAKKAAAGKARARG